MDLPVAYLTFWVKLDTIACSTMTIWVCRRVILKHDGTNDRTVSARKGQSCPGTYADKQ